MKFKILKGLLFSIVLISVSLGSFSFLINIYSLEFDKTSIATYIVDGDTFDIATGERIRLADIDAPERGEAGYSEDSQCLSDWIYNKRVYLDVDDVHVYDTYGTRVVCLVYVDYNSTHYLNINKALLVLKLAEIMDYDNEFSPLTWSLFVPKLGINELLKFLLVSIFIGFITTFLLNLIFNKLGRILVSTFRGMSENIKRK